MASPRYIRNRPSAGDERGCKSQRHPLSRNIYGQQASAMDQRRPDTIVEIERGDSEDYSCTEAKTKRVLEISKQGMAATSAIVLAFFAGRRDITSHASPVHIALCASFTILAFTTCFLLMLLTSDSLIPAAISISQTILIYLSTTLLLMLTAASLLIPLNIHHATIAILLLPIMVITGTLLYHGIRSTYQARSAAGYEVHESELKFFFSISAFVTFLALGVMIPTIFSHYKNFSAHADRQGINRVPECYMFFTVVSGLVTMLLILLPPSLGPSSAREEQFVTVSLFGLLALTGLTAAAAFLGELVVLVFFPDIIGAALWLAKEFFADGRRVDQVRVAASREAELEPLSMVLTAFTFTALMTIYSAYPHSFHLRICTFFIASAFLSSLGRMLLTVKPPSTNSMAALVTTLSLLAIGMVATAVLAAVFFLAGDPEKLNY